MFTSVAGHHRLLQFGNLVYLPWEQRALLPLGVGALLLLRRWRDPRARLVLIFALVAGAWGVFQRLGVGVAYNAQFEMFIALTIAAGAGMAAVDADGVGWPLSAWLRPATVLVLFLPLALKSGMMMLDAPARLARMPDDLARWQALNAAVAASPGPVACFRLAVCYWTGKGFELDFFNYGQQLYAGVSSPAEFESLLRSHRLRLIVVARKMLGPNELPVFPRPSVDAMLRYYRPEPTPVADYMIMRPR